MKAINHCHLVHNWKGKLLAEYKLNSDIKIIIQKMALVLVLLNIVIDWPYKNYINKWDFITRGHCTHVIPLFFVNDY